MICSVVKRWMNSDESGPEEVMPVLHGYPMYLGLGHLVQDFQLKWACRIVTKIKDS